MASGGGVKGGGGKREGLHAHLLLTGRVPAHEADLPDISVEVQRADLHADSGLVLLLELARHVALDERSLACVGGWGASGMGALEEAGNPNKQGKGRES